MSVYIFYYSLRFFVKNKLATDYNKYTLQQNIYKYILEKNYDKKISSMNLLILHPNYLTFHIVQVPEMKDETEYLIEKSKKNITL